MAKKQTPKKKTAKKSVTDKKATTKKIQSKKPIKNAKPKPSTKKVVKTSRPATSRKTIASKSKGKQTIKKPIQKVKAKTTKGNKTRKSVKGVLPTKVKSLEGSILRGKNTIKIPVRGKPENVGKKIGGITKSKGFKYLLNKNKKEPKAVVLIYTVTNEDGIKKTFSKISDSDFIVNQSNVETYIENSTENIASDFDEMYGGENENLKINDVAIKFIY